jgi:hypothetical protein
LDNLYPTVEEKKDIIKIGVDRKKEFRVLTGILNLDSFNNLRELYFPYANIDYQSVKSFPISLEILQLSQNEIIGETLDNFSHLINLRKLDIGSITSGADPRTFLGRLEIFKTDLSLISKPNV